MLTKIFILNTLTSKFENCRYLEIGSFKRETFIQIQATVKHDVEPFPQGFIPTFYKTSHDFFKNDSYEIVSSSLKLRQYDVIFIDGLHHCEQVIEDTFYSSLMLSPKGYIVIHDCLPEKETHASRTQIDNLWMGDVWKAQAWLVNKFPNVYTIENSDCGCGIISGKLSKMQEMIRPTFEDLDKYSWNDYMTNKKELLKITSFEKILTD
jgi:Methyltransferase domain